MIVALLDEFCDDVSSAMKLKQKTQPSALSKDKSRIADSYNVSKLDENIQLQIGEASNFNVSNSVKSSLMYLCNTCSLTFDNEFFLRVHAFEHVDMFFCAVCTAGFAKTTDLYAHYVEHPRKELWENREKLPKRFRRITQEYYWDEIHPQVFKIKNRLSNIKKKKYKKCRCDICGVLIMKHSLKLHLKLHNGVKDHPCKVCGKMFLRLSDARKHYYLVHSDRIRPNCTICGKTVYNVTSLRRHILSHLNERKHACEFCNKRFIGKYELRKHYIVHTGEKAYVCDICGHSFNRGFKNHMLTHAKAK